ncbi:outer membrane beta-barrel domain-containing protein [Bdellovibrio svalbardensis]|uniref:Outer membrane beta-barrel domain-containing protein n=1 Tax=Bdellovibrio svalbardensis TaxID=2972972 RepID=A0ABT6DGP4_9BACT|nr:outer membrane beta-barrel domain-containing protein [Bdellovibrio svalbardensis]MDG0815642.1 outer membrane beta-barrel domain-containing protein [Bdellovibrio svalbardensis]
MSINHFRIIICGLALLWSVASSAQDANSDPEQKDIDFVEKLLETKSVEFKNAPPSHAAPAQKKQKAEYSTVQSESFYSDLATIQKNYMPKTERVQLSGGLTLLPSDVFYRTLGLNIKTSYHFNETWGVEAFGYVFTSQARDEVSKLESVQKLSVKSLVSLTSFYGLNLYFNSIYGKTSFLNNRIIPFEVYQTLGVGKVRTQSSEEVSSIQVGIGDIFSLSRSSALRVDLNWAFYNAHNYLGEEQASNSLFLTVSYGRFFPEPSYR